MGIDDKIRNVAGEVNESVGNATDDAELKAEGKTDQIGAELKQSDAKVNDASRRMPTTSELRIAELSAPTIVGVNNMSLKPGQEDFLSPVSYGMAAAVVNPGKSWQRVVLDGDEVVGFISANFDPDEPREYFRSVLWRINIEADKQRRGVGRFAIEHLLDEARRRGFDHVNAIYEAGNAGPEEFFRSMGFEPIGETEYGEVVGQVHL